MKSKINLLLVAVMAALIILFIYSVIEDFRIQENYTSIPLSFNPYDASSTYNWNGTTVTARGAFIKGKTIQNNIESLIVRSLSQVPTIDIKNSLKTAKVYTIRVENINPVNTDLLNVDKDTLKIVEPHTLEFSVSLKANEQRIIRCSPKGNPQWFEFVMLGDNRDGYETFANIIDQINAINPVFTVDDGDLVYGGEPHKYRLFYETVLKFKGPLYTTLGNHDIRENGRPTYTKLFGPPYYSFTYQNSYFIFLDSSRGWSEKRSIPEEQYSWLESELSKAQGKMIFVFTHVPPRDPRTAKKTNEIPDVSGEEKVGLIERLANNYSEYKSLNHGFPDSAEATRFEDLMTKYKVHTVFASHIHSYLSYIKNNVRYVISGGAGAELLTTNSYYHYLRVKVSNNDTYLETVEIPSPTNQIMDRYIAAVKLFARAIYKEYKSLVLGITVSILSILLLFLWNNKERFREFLSFWGRFITKVFKCFAETYKDLKNK